MSALSLDIISRKDWSAKPAKDINYINKSVPFVIIHHSAGLACNSTPKCSEIVLGIQKYHQNSRGWFDIGYSYVFVNTIAKMISPRIVGFNFVQVFGRRRWESV